MEYDGWLVAAKKLSPGGRGRYAHGCGKDKAMLISNGEHGYSGYCNRCHATPFVPHGRRTFKELMELKQFERKAEADLAEVKLPYDFTLDIPAYAMIWLYKAGITPGRARQHRIGYSHLYNRVILPIYDGDNLVYFQARALYGYQDIKYINPKVDRSAIAYWVVPENADRQTLIITEDILSAIRVGKFLPTASALGTKLSIPLANQFSKYNRVITWLDPDDAGIQGAVGMRKLLSLTTSTGNIYTTSDPKILTDAQIIEEINNVGIQIRS